MMLDRLIIDDKDSLVDFDASVSESKTNPPEKKKIKETIPFSNITYDFSNINGELYWEERKLEYTFEITADNPQELEQKKSAFASWVMAVQNAEIHDPFIEGYHFIGTYDSIEFDDEEHKEKTTAKVVFFSYPYMIANSPTRYVIPLDASAKVEVTINNASAHRLTPTFDCDVAVTVAREGANYAIPKGETTDDTFKLTVGANALTIQNTESTAGALTITFFKEVF